METENAPLIPPLSEPKAKKARKSVPKPAASNVPKADYGGLEVKKGATGKLQKPRHSGAKIRARQS